MKTNRLKSIKEKNNKKSFHSGPNEPQILEKFQSVLLVGKD